MKTKVIVLTLLAVVALASVSASRIGATKSSKAISKEVSQGAIGGIASDNK